MKIHFQVDGQMFEADIDGHWDVSREGTQDLLAKECAKYYHSECDGWEDTWPITLSLHESEHGPAVAAFRVDMEEVPSFGAKLVEAEATP